MPYKLVKVMWQSQTKVEEDNNERPMAPIRRQFIHGKNSTRISGSFIDEARHAWRAWETSYSHRSYDLRADQAMLHDAIWPSLQSHGHCERGSKQRLGSIPPKFHTTGSVYACRFSAYRGT
jgi:hypothetical protein